MCPLVCNWVCEPRRTLTTDRLGSLILQKNQGHYVLPTLHSSPASKVLCKNGGKAERSLRNPSHFAQAPFLPSFSLPAAEGHYKTRNSSLEYYSFSFHFKNNSVLHLWSEMVFQRRRAFTGTLAFPFLASGTTIILKKLLVLFIVWSLNHISKEKDKIQVNSNRKNNATLIAFH